jgi:hypothetical protein
VTGSVGGHLPGATESPVGVEDDYVAAFDASGTPGAVHQFGSSGDDAPLGLAVDGSGHMFVTGYAGTTLEGADTPSAGDTDAFVLRMP